MGQRSKPPAALWIATAALYGVLTALYAPTIDYRPSSLDDASHLALAAEQSADEIFTADRYGHVRPVKSALFWLLAADEALRRPLRIVLLGMFLLATALVQRFATRLSGSYLSGWIAAACWSLHPTATSVTAWLSASSTAPCLVSVLLFLEHAKLAIETQSSARARAWLALASLELVVALLCHELAAVAPVLLAAQLALWRPVGRERSARIVLGASGAIVFVWLAWAVTLGEMKVQYRFADQPAWALTFSSARYVVQHVMLWLTPWVRFGVLLGDRPLEHLVASTAAWAALAVAAALLWKHRARDPVITFGLVWFFVTLAPVANIVPLGNTPIGMHYLYVPSFGLALVVARKQLPRIALAVPLGLLAFWLPQTSSAVRAWGDDETLFARTAASYPRELEPLVNLAAIQIGAQRYLAAQATLDGARAIDPEDIGVVHNQFSLFWKTEQLEPALALLDRHPSIAARPGFQLGRGQALLKLGRFAEAIAPLERALDAPSEPLDEDLRVGAGLSLSLALVQTGRVPEAQRLLDRLLAQYPAHAELRTAAQFLQR